ncbi:iron donor protein CyaY [Spongiibacter sp. KMU-158]|uniref:Iron-sulfur cluster assembly protein CyaY n=1 Tax=Spongiibacter pelagi TaxID=2760804 RepID=A0A927GUJ2_9GAMM|nr:iron donor protein CyaY [Spongiibacter pelagi]MBD2857405.1 iron donor protein CyaY [Spongiibacter pelagi]
MNEADFHDQLDDLYDAIEDAADELEADIDCEISGSVLTLNCPDGSAIIFSRQGASRELWLAARSGGFHFSWNGEQWFSQKENQSLQTLFNQACQEQIGETFALDWNKL